MTDEDAFEDLAMESLASEAEPGIFINYESRWKGRRVLCVNSIRQSHPHPRDLPMTNTGSRFDHESGWQISTSGLFFVGNVGLYQLVTG